MVDVVIDKQEPQYYSDDLSKTLSVRVDRLPVGDFLVYGEHEGDAYIIERKTPGDFVQSIIDGRIFKQAKRLKNSNAKPIYLIEGCMVFTGQWSGLSFNSLLGGLTSLVHDWGILIITLPHRSWTTALIRALAKRIQGHGSKPYPLRTSPKGWSTIGYKRRYLLEGLPNIGAKTSKLILKRYKSPAMFFEAIKNTDVDVKGVGSKTTKQIYEIVFEGDTT